VSPIVVRLGRGRRGRLGNAIGDLWEVRERHGAENRRDRRRDERERGVLGDELLDPIGTRA
jgi:hypothetical protein